MLQMDRGNGKSLSDSGGWGKHHITARDFLTWLIPALLAFISVGMYSTWTRVGDIHDMQAQAMQRITAIESSRFTTSDGLELWREVGGKVDRDELDNHLREIKELIRERND